MKHEFQTLKIQKDDTNYKLQKTQKSMHKKKRTKQKKRWKLTDKNNPNTTCYFLFSGVLPQNTKTKQSTKLVV